MMRLSVAAFLISSALVSSQAAPGQRSVMMSQERVGGINVMVPLDRDAFYLAQPVARVPAEPARQDATLTALAFSVRAWKEGDGARVVVSAVVPVSRGEVETPIATFALAHGESRRVTETEQWGASPVLLRAVARLPR
jgi:hypothetical protein